MSILKEMGYVNVKEMWYSVGGGSVLDGRLELLSDDKGACHMVNIAILNGQVHLFVVHMVSEPQIVHMLEYGGNEVAADEGVAVEDVVEVGEDCGIGGAAVVGDCGVGAAAEVGSCWSCTFCRGRWWCWDWICSSRSWVGWWCRG